MPKLPIDNALYVRPPASPLVEATIGLVQDLVRRRFAESGLGWEDFAMCAADHAITANDMSVIESRILETGHRFDWSAAISAAERPEAHKPVDGAEAQDAGFTHPEAPRGEPDSQGRVLRGVGDNVVRHERDVTGTARYIRSNDRVLGFLTEGVPSGTIAVIDDSGGTLTAPIIEQFAGVICAGGTVRSHLGILTREYNIPCVMNAKISGIREGDIVTIEASAPAKTTEDYQQGVDRTARVWLIGGEAA